MGSIPCRRPKLLLAFKADGIVHLILSRDEKHPDLLPVGALTQFRLDKEKFRLRVDGADKEGESIVTSMGARSHGTDDTTSESMATHATTRPCKIQLP